MPFFISLLLGVALIVGTRLIGTSIPITSSCIAGGLASTVIILLAVFQWKNKEQITDNDPTGTDRVGDELYYLGLIFTLVSLMYGLFYISLSSQYETSEAVTHLVGSFAIALISTLVGIVLRIMFQSLGRAGSRDDDHDSFIGTKLIEPTGPDSTRPRYLDPSTTLSEATFIFEKELRASIEIIKLLRDQFNQEQQTFVHYVRNIGDALEASLNEFPSRSEEVLRVTSAQLAELSTKTLENLGRESTKVCEDVIGTLQSSCAASLANMAERSSETMEQLALKSNEHLNNLSDIYARSEAVVQGTVGKIERDTASYLETVQVSISQTTQVIQDAMTEIRKNTSNFSALSHTVNENLLLGVESLQVLGRTVRNVEDTLSQLQEPAKVAVDEVSTIATDVSIAKTSLDSVVHDLQELQPTIASVKGDSNEIVRDLETVNTQINELQSRLPKPKKSKIKDFLKKLPRRRAR